MTIPEEEQVRFCRTGIKPSQNILLSEQITTFLSLANEACSKERALALKAPEERRKEAVGKAPKKEKGGTSANVAEVKENAGESKPKGQGSRPQNQREQITFTFKDEDVLPIFQALMFKEAIELPPIKYPDEIGREPKYCNFHRGVNHPTSQCFHQKKIIKKCIDKGIVRTKSTANASANEVSIAEEASGYEEAWERKKAIKEKTRRTIPEDEDWDLICPKDIPDAPKVTLKRRHGKQRRKKLQEERQELLKELIPFRPRWYKWSSRHQPFTIDDYLQHERLHPFYKRMKVLVQGAGRHKEEELLEIKGWVSSA